MSIRKYSEIEVYNDFNVTIKHFSNGTKIRIYDKSLRIKKPGFELIESSVPKEKSIFENEIQKTEIESRNRTDNIMRTKNEIIELARANINDWKSFVTLTFRENISDLNFANLKFNQWTHQIKRKYPDFKYLGTYEYQERGAVHYHVLTNLICGEEFLPRQKNTSNKPYFDAKYWNHGYSSALDLSMCDDDFRPDLYITKYMTKDFVNAIDKGRKKLFRSQNLIVPKVEYKLLDESQINELLNQYENQENVKDIKIKTIASANNYCPNSRIVDIVSHDIENKN